MKRSCQAVFLSLGLAALLAACPGAAALAQTPDSLAKPDARVPWQQIEAGLARLAGGDGKAAAASFQKARSTDDSGLAELLMDLTEAYVVYTVGPRDWARALEVNERLEVANQYYYRRHIPSAVLGDALTRIRKLLRQAPAREPSPALLRPLLCNLRLLSRDHATDGEPVLEFSGKSRDVGPLIFQRPVFTPSPPWPEAAREAKTKGSVVIELILDSEGCPASENLLKPLSRGLSDQTVATVKWWAYEPARYEERAVGSKFNLAVNFLNF
jgi:hypothetical protein